MEDYGVAHYDLEEIKNLLEDVNKRIITRQSRRDAVSLGYSSGDDMVKRIKQLKKTEIYKTMEAEKRPGFWQDVYKTNDNGTNLYIKIQKCDEKGVIISFKKDTSHKY